MLCWARPETLASYAGVLGELVFRGGMKDELP